jgi:hypothetical protein
MGWRLRTRRARRVVTVAAVVAAAAVPTVALAGPAAAGSTAAGSTAAGTAGVPKATTAAGLVTNTERTGIVPGEVIALMPSATITGAPLRQGDGERAARTSLGAVNQALSRIGATSIVRDTDGFVLIHVGHGTAAAAAKELAATPGVSFAEPDRYVNTMNTRPQPLTIKPDLITARKDGAGAGLPGNYGYASSLQSYLNSTGDDVGGAYATLENRYHQLPGAGEIVTNVSIGDLTDASMNDTEVKEDGPTTVLENGQRYLDLPSMPLIPTYVSSEDGTLSGTASVEGEDSTLGEVGLDFSVMAPLPDADQRAGETGSGLTDLLGIAPGASYRLVVPADPDAAGIAQALMAAANQTPRPDVITMSLGFSTDTQGFPSRYIEEDPLVEAVVATIVNEYKIVVVDSANDGTRLYTPTSIGPDDGATPTNLARNLASATNINDDADSTTPGEVIDSGSIAAGATTLDDTMADPSGDNPTYVETRTDGDGLFASGFGSRITLSAPGDNIVSLEHYGHTADAVETVLNGGTSASAPEIAAAAADVLQAGRLTHRTLDPAQVTRILEETGHAVATPPQADQTLNVGPQVDVTAAVDKVLGVTGGTTSIVRLSVAQRQMLGEDGAEFVEQTDPADMDMTGEDFSGPITFGADITGPRGDNYALIVDGHTFTNNEAYVRVTPAQLLAAAGLPEVSTTDRTIGYTFQVRGGRKVLAATTQTITLGPSDGTITMAAAPTVAPVVKEGSALVVKYDISNVTNVLSPQLLVSTAGHWNPLLGPVFSAAYSVPLTALSGTVTIPASAFDDGGGIYGIGIQAGPDDYGQFTAVRVAGFTAASRPAAPLLDGGHNAEVTKAAPDFTIQWNTHARGAILEISAPAPTLYNSLNTFTNQNGTQRDNDGIDAGSLVYQRLPSASGTATFSATGLGLPTSLSYDVRVLPTGADGAVSGQASPTSLLTVDDGLIPQDGTLTSYAIAGADSVVAVVNDSGAQLLPYNPATGAYGTAIATDASGGPFDVYGVDPTTGTVLASDDGTVGLYNIATDTLVARPDLTGYTVKGGRVDAGRGRAALLAADTATGADAVIPVNMTTGAAGTPVALGSDVYGDITLDTSTGLVYVGTSDENLCVGDAPANEPIAVVDLDTSTETTATAGNRCDYLLTADGTGGNLYTLDYTGYSANIAGTAHLGVISQSGPARTGVDTLRIAPGFALAADGQHQLAAVLFYAQAGTSEYGYAEGDVVNNNAMSEIDIINTTTGSIVKTIDDFHIDLTYGSGPGFDNEQSLQLDPSTMTGYIYSPTLDEIQSFSY